MSKSHISSIIEFVKAEVDGNDASHDWKHCERVRKTALELAEAENAENLDIIEMSALLHDVGDLKYSKSEDAAETLIRKFLESIDISKEKIDRIVWIVDHVSFHKELKGNNPLELPIEVKIVQDADRLDAIGAIGIARCCTYGGHKKRELYGERPTGLIDVKSKDYVKSTAPTMNHFYEKLLKLKDMMKTESGRKMALQRHEFMEAFLEQFWGEVGL